MILWIKRDFNPTKFLSESYEYKEAEVSRVVRILYRGIRIWFFFNLQVSSEACFLVYLIAHTYICTTLTQGTKWDNNTARGQHHITTVRHYKNHQTQLKKSLLHQASSKTSFPGNQHQHLVLAPSGHDVDGFLFLGVLLHHHIVFNNMQLLWWPPDGYNRHGPPAWPALWNFRIIGLEYRFHPSRHGKWANHSSNPSCRFL